MAVFKPERIAIAWDGSHVAARALADALPLARLAEAVSIVGITGEKDLTQAAALKTPFLTSNIMALMQRLSISRSTGATRQHRSSPIVNGTDAICSSWVLSDTHARANFSWAGSRGPSWMDHACLCSFRIEIPGFSLRCRVGEGRQIAEAGLHWAWREIFP
ncbi:hypothetical protein [Sphingobium baderi]